MLGRGLQSLIPPQEPDKNSGDDVSEHNVPEQSFDAPNELSKPQAVPAEDVSYMEEGGPPSPEPELHKSPVFIPSEEAIEDAEATFQHSPQEPSSTDEPPPVTPPQVPVPAPLSSEPETTAPPQAHVPDVSRETSEVTPSNSVSVQQTQTKHFEEEKYHEPVFHIDVARIDSNPHQPRKIYNQEELNGLAASIREYGVLQPLVVTRVETATPEGTAARYQLIAGERRLLASKIAGLERVPAMIKEQPKEEREKLEMALIENIQRADLNPLDTARAFAKLQDQFGLSQREIAQRLGKSREAVSNTIRLLQLPREAQIALSEGRINESHARLLLSAPDPYAQRAILNEVLEKSLSVREAQVLVDQTKFKDGGRTVTRYSSVDPKVDFMRRQLEEVLGTPVKLLKKGGRGKITINFFSEEELEHLIDRFLKEK